MTLVNFPSPATPGQVYTVNGVTYTYDGVKWSAATADQFVHKAGDTMTGNLTVPSINSGPLAGFRNAIINGNFDVWQRGTSFTALEYGADRWLNNRTGSTCTMSRQAFTLGQTDVPGEPTYFCRMTVSSVAGAANAVALDQRIEDVRTFAGQQVTISFWAKADAAKPIAVELVQIFGTGGSPSAQVNNAAGKFNLTTAWQKITTTVTLPSIAGKTLGSDNNSCLTVKVWFDAGSNFNSRTDSLGQQSGTFDIAQVQLEAGPVATPFERRPIGTELALCQRYYEEFPSASHRTWGGVAGDAGFYFPFKVNKRAAPSIPLSSIVYEVNSSAMGVGDATPYGFRVAWTSGSNVHSVVRFVAKIDAEL